MQTRCQDCSTSFLITPSGATQTAACPNCGGKRLERDQPSPVKGDGEMSANNPGMGINQRGVPEREGIFGGDSNSGIDTGWKPWRQRDESFASVKTAATPSHEFLVDNGMIHNGNHTALEWFDTHVNGRPTRGGTTFWRGEKDGPATIHVHHPEHEDAVREIIENGADMNGPPTLSQFAPGAMETMRAIGRGEVPPPVGANINNVSTPEEAEEIRNGRGYTSKIANDIDFSMFEPTGDTRTPTHKFIIDGAGQTYSKPEPTWHEDIAEHHGIAGPDFPKGLSQGVLYDNGDTDWFTHDTHHSANALASMLHGHFGHPVSIDPNLKPSTSEERFKLDNPETRDLKDVRLYHPERENDLLEALKERVGKPFGYYENPFINRGGSVERTLNMDPYMPWTHEATEKTAFWPLIMGLAETLGAGAASAGAAEGAAAAGGSGLMGGLMGGAMGQGAGGVGKNMLMGQGIKSLIPGQGGGGGGAPAPPPFVPDPGRLSKINKDQAKNILDELGHDFDLDQFHQGMNIELEHTDVTKGDPHLTGQIAAAHLKEDSQYYVKLKKVEGRVADLQTPVSNPSYHEAPDGDTKQFGLGDHDPAAQNPNLPGEAGGSAKGEDGVREHAGFAPGSAGVERAQMLLPLLLHYYHSDKSGADDPLIKSLHEQLDTEAPGYLDQADHAAVDKWLNAHKENGVGVHARVANPWGFGAVPDTYDTRPEGPAFTQQVQNPDQQPGVCPYCQGRQAQDGSCPQCGAKGPDQSNTPGHPDLSGGARGPAVTQTPQSVPPPGFHGKVTSGQGHCEHCGSVVDAQGNCPQCGAQVPSIENPGAQAPDIGGRTASNHQGPTTPEQISAVQQYLIDNGRVDEVPDVPLRPELYANELSEINGGQEPPPTIDPSQTPPPQPTQEIAPPGATMPVPNPASPQMQQPLARVAADPEPSAIDNPIGVPAADQQGQRDIEQEQDSSHTWQTDNGEPLQVGQTYEMHSEQYAIPDIVKVINVKPSAITVETVGEFSADPNQQPLNYQHEVSHEEAQLEGLSFVPQDGQHEDANGPENGQPDTTESPVNTEPTPVAEQHETRASVQVDDDKCPKCSSDHITSSMSSATTSFHECYRCGNAWEVKEEDYSTDGSKVASWILDDNPGYGDDFFAEMERHKALRESGSGSRNLSDIASKDPRYNVVHERLNEAAMQREAGKKFTPKEQREYIDERGIARNADKLDLAGTHYESHRYLDKANGENVDDAHLFMGF